MSSDLLVEKLEGMDKRRELSTKRISLRDALELLADAPTDNKEEMDRWGQFINTAHARGDFRWMYELTRQEFQAVNFGRPVEVFSTEEIRQLFQKAGAFALESVQSPQSVLARSAVQAAKNEGRIYGGRVFSRPDPSGKPAQTGFRSKADIKREETPEEIAREVDAKLGRFAIVAETNAAIDRALEQAGARLVNGEAVIPNASLLSILESGLTEIIRANESPNRVTDASTFPRWNELLLVYNDVRGKVAPFRVDPVAGLLARLNGFWNQQDQEYLAIAERVTGSPDAIPLEVINRAAPRLGYMAGGTGQG